MPELIWTGKYDERGKKVAPFKVALPFQTVETVNESNNERTAQRSLFASGRETEWRNRLIWGDKKYVLPSLLPELAGQVNLIYIDPPFDTGADFSFTAQIPDDPDTPGDQSAAFVKEPSLLELKAYRDIWGGAQTHLDAYLKWFHDTASLLHELLAPNGSIYVHIGHDVSHAVKCVCDEIFGYENFVNQIVWKRSHAHSDSKQGSLHFGRLHEVILLYSKSEKYTFNQLYKPYEKEYIDTYYKYVEEGTGRRYWLDNLQGPGGAAKGNPQYEVMGVTRFWRYSRERMQQLIQEGRVIQTSPGTVPKYKRYLDEMPGRPIQDIWDDVKSLGGLGGNVGERLDYPTQKPEALLERIIKASSNAGDLVLDCFCGSGTTAAVSEKLGRRWITCDLGRFAIHTARKRLLSIPDVKPFVVQNLGKYERQAWATERMKDEGGRMNEEAQKQRAYRQFILDLYHATPLEGYVWLHGVKNGRLVHVGSVDAPVSDGDITNIAREFRRARGSGENAPTSNGIDVLGWEFAFEINEIKKESAEAAGIQLRPLKIPREIMEKRAAEQGDIQFFELAALELKTAMKERTLTVELGNFISPPDYLPADVQKNITHWEQLIDYWAIDWNYGVGEFGSDTFHNQWQSYRTKANPRLDRQARHTYEAPGTYTVVVKVIDILGNDTTKAVRVTVE